MQKGSIPHRSDLAVTKEPAQRDVAELISKHVGIVVGFSVQVLSSTQAGKQQRTARIL